VNWQAESAKWEAKYKSVTGLVEPHHVDAAEQIIESAIRMSQATRQPLTTVVEQLCYVAWKMKGFSEPDSTTTELAT